MCVEVCGPGSEGQRPSFVHFRNGGSGCSLNYTEHLETLIAAWCRAYPQLGHIDMDRIIVAATRCRSKSSRGVYASVTSLRSGRSCCVDRSGRRFYRWPRIRKDGREALYLLKFYLPRFHNLTLRDKVSTILHELHHIHPRCNGEFRVFPGRNWAHGPSQREFERMFEGLRRDIMKRLGPLEKYFLGCRFATLLKRYGSVYARRMRLTSAGDGAAVLS